MTPVLIVLALVASAGAVVACGAREPRFVALGMLVALLAAAYVSDPLPGAIALAARLTGAVLGGYLVWVSLRGVPLPASGSHLGWAGAAAIAIVAFVAGWFGAVAIGDALRSVSGEGPTIGAAAPGLVAGSSVSRASMGAAFALATLSAGSMLLARDVLRLGVGLVLMVGATERLLAALGGTPEDLAVLAFGLLIAAGGATVGSLVSRAIRLQGDLELRAPSTREVAVRTRGADEAHPLGRRR